MAKNGKKNDEREKEHQDHRACVADVLICYLWADVVVVMLFR